MKTQEQEAQDPQRTEMENPSEQQRILSKTPAPNPHHGQGRGFKDRDAIREGLANHTSQKKPLESPRQKTGAPTSNIVTGDRTNGQADYQLTLLHLLRADLSQLDQTKGKNGILVHGPSHQGPRTALMIQEEPIALD